MRNQISLPKTNASSNLGNRLNFKVGLVFGGFTSAIRYRSVSKSENRA